MILTRWLAVKADRRNTCCWRPGICCGCWCVKLLGKGDGKLEDNIVTRMVRTAYPGAVEFDIKRLAINAGGLLIGAIETTSQAVSQVIQYLLDNPQWLAKAQGAAQSDNPAVFDGIVWEALRFVPISSFISADRQRIHHRQRHGSRHHGAARQLRSGRDAVSHVRYQGV